jgi:hypothetical protein
MSVPAELQAFLTSSQLPPRKVKAQVIDAPSVDSQEPRP